MNAGGSGGEVVDASVALARRPRSALTGGAELHEDARVPPSAVALSPHHRGGGADQAGAGLRKGAGGGKEPSGKWAGWPARRQSAAKRKASTKAV